MKIVADCMSKRIVSVESNIPFGKVIELMAGHDISCVLVTKKDRLVGILTERDMVKRVLRGKSRSPKIELVMTKDLITISPHATVEDASFIMRTKRIKQLPVLDSGQLVGIITQTDIIEETLGLSSELRRFLFYQNVQTSVILLFMAFIVFFFVYKVILLR